MLNPNYISLDSILEKVKRDYGFIDVDRYETAERIWEVINYLGITYAYTRKALQSITVSSYRFPIPVDFFDFGSVGAIRECSSGITLTRATDIFQKINTGTTSDITTSVFEGPTVVVNADGTNGISTGFVQVTASSFPVQQLTFDMQDGWFYTGFEKGKVDMIYNAFPVSEDGTPKVPDDAKYVRAVVGYIGYMIAFKLYLRGEYDAERLNRIEKEYMFAAGAARTSALTPDVHMMETMLRMQQRLIPTYSEHASGFRSLGDQQLLKNM
jgi:hypothetical protein